MFKRIICCLTALFLVTGLCAANKNKSKKETKLTKKERKAAKKQSKTDAKIFTAIPGLPAEADNWKQGPNRTWEVNFNNAVLKARAEKKMLYVLASGSDWCPPCKRLKSTVLGNSKFRKMAEKSFVLVFIDFPRNIKLPATQKQHNAMVAKKFPFGGGVPSALIIEPNSLKVAGKISGYKPAKMYIQELSKFAKK
ncbi:MAG: thioredoxin family protein [Lentisphaeria bacterium]|nr:thioredoxin family protein [Lentisphaeria bacterium]MBQ7396110.1 thioredoxin family protein [Lentisphaeria bacterium]MBR7119584.1 thioredoxin family protein [Lentisphaeria bacterium]